MIKCESEKCTIVVSSCDKYEDLWGVFFKLFHYAWPTNPFPIILNTESKSYYDENCEVRCFQLYNGSEVIAWGERLKKTLKKIESEYILFFLDDFWIDGKVDEEEIFSCIQRMDVDQSISVFSFMQTSGAKYDDGKYENYERRKQFGKYRFNCQAALWRRKHLLQYLRDKESPWDWEVYGNWRSYRYWGRKFYSRKAECKQTIPYIFEAGGKAHGGLVLVGGKWYLPLVEHFESRYAIRVNRNVREVMTEEEFGNRFKTKNKVQKAEWKQKLTFLKKTYYGVLKIFDVLLHLKHVF